MLSVIVLSVVVLSVVMLSVIMLSVVVLSVVTPQKELVNLHQKSLMKSAPGLA